MGSSAGLPCPLFGGVVVSTSSSSRQRTRRAKSEARLPGWESTCQARHRRPGRTPPPAHARTDRARVAPSGAARREAAPDPGALGPTGREPSATPRGVRQPEVSRRERDGAPSGPPSTDPKRARRWHSPHVASGTARTRPALAVGVRSRGPGVSREPVECAGGGLATRARRRSLSRIRWHIPACSHGFLLPHEFHAIGCGRSAAPGALWAESAPKTRVRLRPATHARLSGA